MNGFYQPYWNCDELEHHGILGMRLGIRRYQNPDGSLTAAGKKRYYNEGTHGEILGQSRDRDIRINKGTEAYRLQEGNKLKPGQSYISFDKLDHLEYLKSTAGGEGGLTYTLMYTNMGEKKDNNAYSMKLKLTNDLIAPSYEKTMDAFINMVGQVKISDIFGDAKTGYDKQMQKQFEKNIKKFTVEECRDAAYEQFSSTLMKDTKGRQIFFNNLRNMGYNAIVDENDARFGKGYTKSPIIVFDSSNIKATKATPVSAKDIDYFSEIYWGGISSKQASSNFKKKWSEYLKEEGRS